MDGPVLTQPGLNLQRRDLRVLGASIRDCQVGDDALVLASVRRVLGEGSDQSLRKRNERPRRLRREVCRLRKSADAAKVKFEGPDGTKRGKRGIQGLSVDALGFHERDEHCHMCRDPETSGFVIAEPHLANAGLGLSYPDDESARCH
jgi:hypothetical protein